MALQSSNQAEEGKANEEVVQSPRLNEGKEADDRDKYTQNEDELVRY